jgi:effector-binding domain-containing protein
LEIKTTDLMMVLSPERMIKIPEVAAVSAELCPAMMQDAERQGLVINGPWIVVSHSLPKDGQTAFRIEFCLPVSDGITYRGDYVIKSLKPIVCAAKQYRGPLQTLFSDGYGPLLQAIDTAGHALSGESREVYHQWEGPGATDNQIEIQFGLR